LSAARAAAVLAPALLAISCIGPGDFRCTEHAQCMIGTQPGSCEANGRCSVPDSRCEPSGRRYAHRAGDDADACVPASCPANTLTSVSAGGGHACLRRADGSLWCWGRNDHGQLGDGTRTSRATPVRVPDVSDVVAVATGDAHTCALLGNHTLSCWGADDLGQLGDGGGQDRGFPRAVMDVSDATAIAAGKDFSCAAFADGSVRCWGDDSVGQLGDGGAAASTRGPVVVAGVSGVMALSARWQHACALGVDGHLACWGANASGQIGDGTTTGPRLPTSPSMLPVITAVATGRDHTCALAADGLRCWGANDQGQVDPAQPSPPIAAPKPVTGVDRTNAIAVAAGAQHTCIVRGVAEHPVACWGASDSGQLGGGAPMANATAVVAGAEFSCAVAADDAVYCWGDNHFGQLAIGGDTTRATAAPVEGLAHATTLAAGGAHTCATADDAQGAPALFCWGANDSGQLGDASSIDAPTARRISSLAPVQIAAGRAHTCAFPADRQLRCWGWGASGQLGRDPAPNDVFAVPTVTDLSPPDGGDGLYAVTAGAEHTCVGATISASVLCFGLNTDGQLGNGVQSDQIDFKRVPALLGKAAQLVAGDGHTCALDADGAIWCWGRGDQGQLGDGLGVEHPSPTAVKLMGGVTAADAIAAGASHTCALAGGKIQCWGRNAEGQVGSPVQVPLLSPTSVAGISGARAIAAGGRHTCAIGADATVSCWGANESGQLGDGTTESSNVPVAVTGLTAVDAITVGGAHSCARRSDGSVWCWGANTSGQLGDGVTLTSGRPLLARIACQ